MERRSYSAEHAPELLLAATSLDVRQTAAKLRQVCPPPLPVVVRAVYPQDYPSWGDCCLANEGKPSQHFQIGLIRGLPVGMMHMVMIHEWAHILDWRPSAPFRQDHRPTYGVHWAEVHCEFYGVT